MPNGEAHTLLKYGAFSEVPFQIDGQSYPFTAVSSLNIHDTMLHYLHDQSRLDLMSKKIVIEQQPAYLVIHGEVKPKTSAAAILEKLASGIYDFPTYYSLDFLQYMDEAEMERLRNFYLSLAMGENNYDMELINGIAARRNGKLVRPHVTYSTPAAHNQTVSCLESLKHTRVELIAR